VLSSYILQQHLRPFSQPIYTAGSGKLVTPTCAAWYCLLTETATVEIVGSISTVEKFIRKVVAMQKVSQSAPTHFDCPLTLDYAVNLTLSIDLSTSWSTNDVNPIVTLHQSGNNMLTRDATMFYDGISDMVYWYRRLPYFNDFQPAVRGFKPNNGAALWQNIYDIGIRQTTTGSTFPNFTYTVGSLWTSTPTAYYSLGGYIAGATDAALGSLGWTPVSGLVEFKFQEGSRTNTSDSGYREQGFSVHGEAVYVPIFGKEGIIVFLGGDTPTSQVYIQGSSLAQFSDITVYDISSGNYYQQTATGSPLPMSRIQLCAAGVAAADNSSFEM
jgi:hypothetical protein